MKPSPDRLILERYPCIVTMQTRFADMDPQHHLNNVAIAGLYEDGRVRLNNEIMAGGWGSSGPRTVAAHVSIAYLREGFYPGEVTLGGGILSVGRSSYVMGQAMFQNGECIGVCDSTLVYREDAGPAPLPEALRATFERFMIGRPA